MRGRKDAVPVLSALLSDVTNTFWLVFDVLSWVFALAFYVFLTGLAFYAMASVIYNLVIAHRRRKVERLVLAHQRRKAERPEPPTARRGPTVYPEGKK